MGAARGSLPSPDFPPCSAGRRSPCTPEGSWCGTPSPARRVWWSSLEAAGVTMPLACRWLFVPCVSTGVPQLSPRVPCAPVPCLEPCTCPEPPEFLRCAGS